MLESHLQSETRYHLHLSCCKLNDTKNEVRNLQLEVEKLQGQEDNHHNEIERRAQALQHQFQERAQALQNQFEERVQALQNQFEERVQALQNHFEDREQVLQNHFEDRLHAFQNHFEDRVQALENHFEERINLLTVTINRLRKNLKFTSIVFAVTVVILAALNGMSNRESAVLNRLENNIMRNVEEQSNLEMKMDEVQRRLEENVTDLRSQSEGKMNEAQKYLAAMSLNISNQESAVSDLKTKMDRSFERQSKLEMKMNEVEKGLKGELIDLRSQLWKKLDEANNYFEAVSLNMSNHESAVSNLKTKMDRSFERQSKLIMKMNEVEKGLKGELIDLRSQLWKKLDEANNYFEAVSLNMSNHESAVRDFKTKMESRVTDVQTKLEGKLDEANKSLKEKVS